MNTIQGKLAIALTSPAVWGMVILFAYNAIEANLALFPTGATTYVNIVLLLLSGYLHTSHVQGAAQLGTTRV